MYRRNPSLNPYSFPPRNSRKRPYQPPVHEEEDTIARKRPRRASASKKKFFPGETVDAFWHEDPYHDWFSAEVISVSRSKEHGEIIHVQFEGEEEIWGLQGKFVRPFTKSAIKSQHGKPEKAAPKPRKNPLQNPAQKKKKNSLFKAFPPPLGRVPTPPMQQQRASNSFLRRRGAPRSRPPPMPNSAIRSRPPPMPKSAIRSRPPPMPKSEIRSRPPPMPRSAIRSGPPPNFHAGAYHNPPPHGARRYPQRPVMVVEEIPRLSAYTTTGLSQTVALPTFDDDDEIGLVIESKEDCEYWETSEVGEWLDQHGFGNYEEQFRVSGIDGRLLKQLSFDDLRQDLRIVNEEHLRKLYGLIQTLGK